MSFIIWNTVRTVDFFRRQSTTREVPDGMSLSVPFKKVWLEWEEV